MVNLITSITTHIGVLTVDDNSLIDNRIFGLDSQLLIDTVILALAVFTLFLLLSYLVFNPARELLKKRQAKINDEMEFSAKEKEDAIQFKKDYEAKLKNASVEVDELLSEGRKKALIKENEIVNGANEEAQRILERANKEVELEKSKLKDEVKQEMIAVASVMAGKIIAGNIDEAKQAKLVDETLSEMGDSTWQN